MSNYGSRTNADGSTVSGDGKMPVMTGERVGPCTLIEAGMQVGDDGAQTGRGVLKYSQPNGAVFTKMFFENTDDWAVEETNRQLLHIAKRVMSEDDYYNAIAGATNFTQFMTQAGAAIKAASEGKEFDMKIILKKNSKGEWFPNIPKYPNFIEISGAENSTLSTSGKGYDIYEIPTETTAEEAVAETAEDDVF